MINPEYAGITPDAFESYKENCLRGKGLKAAEGGTHDLIVAYERAVLKLDAFILDVGKRAITGSRAITMCIDEPGENSQFTVSLKSKRGIIPAGELVYDKFDEFGQFPAQAVLHEREQIDMDAEDAPSFDDEDEKWFQTAYSVHDQRRISMHSGAFGLPPRRLPDHRP